MLFCIAVSQERTGSFLSRKAHSRESGVLVVLCVKLVPARVIREEVAAVEEILP